MRAFLAAFLVLLLASSSVALKPDVLPSSGGIPAHIAGRFREAAGFQQSAFGQYFIFDRRGHTVFGVDEQQTSVWQIVHIGPEAGRIIEPTAFSVAPDGTFVVADAPEGRERIQIFSPVGFRTGGFMLPGRSRPRMVFGNFVLNGIGSLQYTGSSILMSQPETGGLVTEYALDGGMDRTFGSLRATGQEDDREVQPTLFLDMRNMFNQQDRTSPTNSTDYTYYGIRNPRPDDPNYVKYGDARDRVYAAAPRLVQVGLRMNW